MTTTAEERAAQRHQIRKEAILEAAAAEFAESGYENARLDEIGKRVGLSRGSLYYYVDSKEAIMAELFVRFTDEIERNLPDHDASDASQRLQSFLLAHIELAARTPHVAATAGNRGLYLNSASEELKTARRRHQKILIDILEEGIESGEFTTSLHVRTLANMIFGAINTIPEGQNLALMSATDIALGTVNLLLGGLHPKVD